jgi:methyl-accepting chemotaxis protein
MNGGFEDELDNLIRVLKDVPISFQQTRSTLMRCRAAIQTLSRQVESQAQAIEELRAQVKELSNGTNA